MSGAYYFTWPDRGLAYDCRGCGACCRGLGIGVDAAKGELESLIGRYPELAPMARRRGPAWTLFNPRDRCWFLDDGGLCRVETEHGRAAKPASCRLFPFNRIFHVGGVTVVDFNSVICPLVRADDGVTHGEVVRDLESIEDPAIVGTSLPGDPGFAEREQRIAEACFTGDVDVAWAAMSERPLAESLDRVSEALASFTGPQPALPTPETLSNALVLTPSMRFNELYGPRKLDPLPEMTLAWIQLAAIGADLAHRELSLQELTTLWSEVAPLAYAAARWHDAPRLEPGPVELPPAVSDPAGIVRAFGEACTRNRKQTLGELWPEASPAESAALLKLATPILAKLDFST